MIANPNRTEKGQKNSAVIDGWYAAANHRDRQTMQSFLDPNVEWTVTPSYIPNLRPSGNTYRGAEFVLDDIANSTDAFDVYLMEIEQNVIEEDTLVEIGYYRCRYKGSQTEFTTPFVHIWKIKDGKIAKLRQIVDSTPFISNAPN